MSAPSAQPQASAEFAIPAGAVDSHAHVFGPVSRFPLAERRAYTPPDATVEAYLAMLDSLGLAHGVLVQGSAHGLDNAAMLNAIAMAAGRLRGIAVVRSGTGIEKLRRLAAAGVVGLRFYGDGDRRYGGGVGVDAACALAGALADLGMHAQLLVTDGGLRQHLARMRNIGCALVIDHLGSADVTAGIDDADFSALCEALAEERCWVKLSAVYRLSRTRPDFDDVRVFHDALVAANPARCLWGSDWPHPNFAGDVPDDAQLLNVFARWTRDPHVRRGILVDNPARLFGFG